MRKLLCLGMAGFLTMTLVGASRAEEKADAKEIIAKAIKAAGGAEKIEKFKGITWTEKGTFYGMGAGVPYTGTYAVQHPNKFKMDIENAFVIILDGDKGWFSGNDMPKEQLDEQKQGRHAEYLLTLVPILKGDGFQLDSLPEIKVGDKPAVGVKVSSKGHRDVKMYFDKDSGLLVKGEYKVKDEQSGQEVNQELTYSDHKEIEGIKVPTKFVMKRDGNQYVEAERTDLKLTEKLDDKTFAKP